LGEQEMAMGEQEIEDEEAARDAQLDKSARYDI
jgi:hypothetical protein